MRSAIGITKATNGGKLAELTDAERQMIQLLRHDKHVTVTISKDDDDWHMRLEDHNTGIVGDGHGRSFDQAWDDIKPAYWRERLGDRP